MNAIKNNKIIKNLTRNKKKVQAKDEIGLIENLRQDTFAFKQLQETKKKYFFSLICLVLEKISRNKLQVGKRKKRAMTRRNCWERLRKMKRRTQMLHPLGQMYT